MSNKARQACRPGAASPDPQEQPRAPSPARGAPMGPWRWRFWSCWSTHLTTMGWSEPGKRCWRSSLWMARAASSCVLMDTMPQPCMHGPLLGSWMFWWARSGSVWCLAPSHRFWGGGRLAYACMPNHGVSWLYPGAGKAQAKVQAVCRRTAGWRSNRRCLPALVM